MVEQGQGIVVAAQNAGVTVMTALFLVLVVNRLVDGLVKPVFHKFSWDSFWLMYVAWVGGALLVWLSGVNLFTAYIPDPMTGQVLTAIVAGGGANLLNDLFPAKPQLITSTFVGDALRGPTEDR